MTYILLSSAWTFQYSLNLKQFTSRTQKCETARDGKGKGKRGKGKGREKEENKNTEQNKRKEQILTRMIFSEVERKNKIKKKIKLKPGGY